jgi:predicted transcriptional regulator
MLAMPRARTTKVLVGFRINAKLLERLEAIALQQGRNRSEMLDRAVEDYVTRMESQQLPAAAPAAKPAEPRKSKR